jgi:ribosome modulation factor
MKQYYDGYRAYMNGQLIDDCEYQSDSGEGDAWVEGWQDAERDDTFGDD